MREKILILTIICPLVAMAAKIHPTPAMVKQPDGTELIVLGFGGEDGYYFATTDGVLLYKEGTTFFIANINDDGELTSTGVLAHQSDMRGEEEKQVISSQNTELFYGTVEKIVKNARIRREPMSESNTLFAHTGSPRVPVILVEFTDTTFAVSDPKAVFDKYLNAEDLFNTTTDPEMGRNYGSVKRYFTDMSGGIFTPIFDVYGPYTLPNSLKYYGGGAASSENTSDLIKHACSIADDVLDFSQYDENEDGLVDLICVIYAGYSESYSANSTDCIYPKSGTITTASDYDGKALCRYCVSNELNATPADQVSNGLLINGIGLFCHEFSHCLGLPDMYPASGSTAEKCINQNLDYWDLMDAGEYTYNGYRPTEYTAWERERFGWTTIDTLFEAADVALLPLSQAGKAYRILNDNDETGHEYYIVENIQNSGWNRSLYGHGMLIYHVDYDDDLFAVGGTRVNNTAGHPRMSIMAADGMFVPEYYLYTTIEESTNSTVQTINLAFFEKYNGVYFSADEYKNEQAGDPFPGSYNVTSFTNDTSPMSAWVYVGGYMSKPITEISEDTSTGVVTFKFMGGVKEGISAVDNTYSKDTSMYLLDGRKVKTGGKKLSKGVYIKGEKKWISQ